MAYAMEESLISDDSSDEADFEKNDNDLEQGDDESQTRKTRRNFNIPIEVMKDAFRHGGSKDANGVPCATATEIATYIAKSQNVPIDRSLRNAVAHRLRTGKEYEKREEKLAAHQKREHKSYFYIRGSRKSTGGSGGSSNPSANSGTAAAQHSSISSGVSAPPITPTSNLSNLNDGATSSVAKIITNQVPNFGGVEGHRCYFHREALLRGMYRANKIISRLGLSTGLHDVLGELNVEILSNESCDETRWATLLGWHDKYDRMRKVFAGIKDDLVEGYRFVLVLNCRKQTNKEGSKKRKKSNVSGCNGEEICEPISVASITPHRVYNKPTVDTPGGSSGEHWHVEIELQTLLVPVEHQGKGIGTVMQKAMYVLAQSLASEPDPPIYDDDDQAALMTNHIATSSIQGKSQHPFVWKATCSPYIGRRIARMSCDENNEPLRVVRGVVESWLPAEESAFFDSRGKPAPLWRIRYTSSGPLDGELEDLEEYELRNSLPPPLPPFVNTFTSKTGKPISKVKEDEKKPSPLDYIHPFSSDKAEKLDAEEAKNLSLSRITCVTTVYLDDMARKFYLKNDMKEMLPPYDDGTRRGNKGSNGCAPRSRIWENCDHKRLHWWYNTIYGSSFNDDTSPERCLEIAIANTVECCKQAAHK